MSRSDKFPGSRAYSAGRHNMRAQREMVLHKMGFGCTHEKMRGKCIRALINPRWKAAGKRRERALLLLYIKMHFFATKNKWLDKRGN